MRRRAALLLLAVTTANPSTALWVKPRPHSVTGTAVAIPNAFQGQVFLIEEGTTQLPDFKGRPVGTIYTTALNIPQENFLLGFPGVTNRFEWFAIDYKASFWVRNPGKFGFILTSDDGAILYVDGKPVVDNNGTHPAVTRGESIRLTEGSHQIRLSYFQGPRYEVAPILLVSEPGLKFRVFDTQDFLPPAAP